MSLRHIRGTRPRVLLRFRQGHRSRNERQVRQRLREIPKHLIGFGVVFLGKEAQVVAGGHGTLEDLAGLVPSALTSQALRKPKGTG